MKLQPIPSLSGRQDPERYRSSSGIGYVPPLDIGYAVIPMLEFLKGLPWNELALNYVHALQPSRLRVTNGCTTTDASPGRVTVYVNDDGVIENIEQEVSVGLRGAKGPYDLLQQLRAAQKERGN